MPPSRLEQGLGVALVRIPVPNTSRRQRREGKRLSRFVSGRVEAPKPENFPPNMLRSNEQAAIGPVRDVTNHCPGFEHDTNDRTTNTAMKRFGRDMQS